MGTLFGIINGSSRFIWGYLMDIFGFKCLMIIISFMELTVSLTIFYVASKMQNIIIYIIENLIIALCLSGTFTMITPTFSKIFGNKGAEIYGITGMSIGFASFLGPILTKILIVHPGVKDYEIVYFSGGTFVILNLITLFIFKEQPFVFKNKNVDEGLFDRLGYSISNKSNKDNNYENNNNNIYNNSTDNNNNNIDNNNTDNNNNNIDNNNSDNNNNNIDNDNNYTDNNNYIDNNNNIDNNYNNNNLDNNDNNNNNNNNLGDNDNNNNDNDNYNVIERENEN
jgi:hypothetical protein